METNGRDLAETHLAMLNTHQPHLVLSGDRVVGRFVYRGTHTGEFMGIPAIQQMGALPNLGADPERES